MYFASEELDTLPSMRPFPYANRFPDCGNSCMVSSQKYFQKIKYFYA